MFSDLILTPVLFATVLVGFIDAGNVCVQRVPGCVGTELECSRSVSCSHGNCLQNGVCACDRCWRGDGCYQYVDTAPPVFAFGVEKITTYPSDTDIYTSVAKDQDLWTTCEGFQPCPCADVAYAIKSGNDEEVFKMDSATGLLSRSSWALLQPGSTYRLVLAASSQYSSSTHGSTMEIEIYVEDDMGPVVEDDDETSVLRKKRAVSTSSSSDTQIQLVQETSGNVIQPGKKFSFSYEISLPNDISMDMKVELFTFDPLTSQTAFILCDPKIKFAGSAVSSPEATNLSAMIPDVSGALFDNRAVFDFGELQVADNSDSKTRMVIIEFGVSLVIDPINVSKNNTYYAIAGAEYDNSTFVMIGQAQLIADTSLSPPYASYFFVDEVTGVAVDDYVLLTGHYFSTNPYGNVTVESFSATNNKSVAYSVANMRVASAGSNYCRRYNLLNYNAAYFSVSENSPNYRGSLHIPSLANCDGARVAVNDTGNEMVFEIAVLVPNNANLVDEVLQMAIVTTVDPTTVWTQVVDIPIAARIEHAMVPPTMTISSDNLQIVRGGAAIVSVTFTMKPSSYSNIVLELLAPNAAVSVCPPKLVSKGFNILIQPGYTSIETSKDVGKDVITERIVNNFGRVINTFQLPSTNESANRFTVEFGISLFGDDISGPVIINLKNSETESSAVVSTQISISVVDGTQPATLIEDASIVFSPVTNLNLYVDGSAAFLLYVMLEPQVVLASTLAMFMTSLEPEDPLVKICRVDVAGVRRGLPCMNRTLINSRATYDSKATSQKLNVTAGLYLGTICYVAEEDVRPAFALRVALQLPRQKMTSDKVVVSAGMMTGFNSTMWTGYLNLTVNSGAAKTFPKNCSTRVDLVQSLEYVTPGSAAVFYLRMVIPAASVADHSITVNAVDSKASLCSITILSVGYNMPCVDSKPIPGDLSFGKTMNTINYVPRENAKDGNANGVLDFRALANSGMEEDIPYMESDDNVILVGVTVKIHETTTSNVTFSYSTKIGDVTGPPTSVVIPVDNTAESTPDIIEFNTTVSVIGGDSLNVNASKLVAVDFQVPVNFTGPVSVKFTSPLATPIYKICAVAVTSVGENLPCLNASLIFSSYDSSIGDVLNCSDVAVLDMGVVCSLPIRNDPSQYWVRAEASVSILDDEAALSAGNLPVDIMVSVSGNTVTKTVTLVPTATAPDIVVNTSGITFRQVLNVSNFDAKIGRPVQVGINFTLPMGTTNAPASVTVSTPSANGRAIVLVKSLKVTAVGLNVRCIPRYLEFELLTSEGLTTRQKDILFADLGYITNTGMSYRRGFPLPFDDEVTFEVELVMTDHPLAEHNSLHKVQFVLEIDGEITNRTMADVELIAIRDNTERPYITGYMSVPTPAKIHHTGDVVDLRLILSHAEYSTAEPTSFTVRIFCPPYIQRITLNLHNVSVAPVVSGSPFRDLEVPGVFLFGDIYELNLTVVVDPENSRGHEASVTNATIVGRVYAVIAQRNGYPADPTKPFPGEGFHTLFEVGGLECFDALGLQDGRIADCQLMASTAVDVGHGPQFARLNLPQGQGWYPNLRPGGHSDYLRVYFGNVTRITRVAVEKDSCCRAVTALAFFHSDDGVSWKPTHKNFALNYTGNIALVDIPKPPEARHFKLWILGVENPESASTLYVNVRAELYGCPVSSDSSHSTVCDVQPQTTFSDSAQYRHFVVNTNEDIIFICDVGDDNNKLNCFCSKDGTSWTAIDSKIDRMIGFQPEGNVVFAQSSETGTYFRSSDCNTWILVEESEVITANSSAGFVGSNNVPAVATDDPRISATKGSWTSSFDGLSFNGNQKATWRDSCPKN